MILCRCKINKYNTIQYNTDYERAPKRRKFFKFPNPPRISTTELKVLMKDQQQIRIPDQMEPPCPEFQFTLKMAASSKDAETCLWR